MPPLVGGGGGGGEIQPPPLPTSIQDTMIVDPNTGDHFWLFTFPELPPVTPTEQVTRHGLTREIGQLDVDILRAQADLLQAQLDPTTPDITLQELQRTIDVLNLNKQQRQAIYNMLPDEPLPPPPEPTP